MAAFHVLCVLWCVWCVSQVQCVGFHLPPPDSFTHSCTPLGSWAVAGNVTLSEVDAEFYSRNLTFRIGNRDLCSIDLESCPELATSTPSSLKSPNVCECLSRFSEDDYSIYIRQEIKASDIGTMLTVIVPSQPKYAPLQSTHDIGLIPSKKIGNITYQINSGNPTHLTSTQNISTCRDQPVTITVCAPHSHPGTVLKIQELWQTMTSLADHCIHIIEKFNFEAADTYPVVFTFDEGAGCPFQEKFFFNIQEQKNNCPIVSIPASTTMTTSSAPATSTSTSTTQGITTAPNAPCPETSTSPPRKTVTLSNGIQALCDTWTQGGNWIVIQRRSKGDVDFYRGWTEYVAGFGDLDGDHWMGLQDIHTLCPPSRPCSLRIDLKDDQVYKNNVTVWAEYSSFSLGGFTEKYRLSISGFNTSSTVKDSLSAHHHGIPFSTYDRDDDVADTRHCAVEYHGGWWYYNCYDSNLNGQWGARDNLGLSWHGATSTLHATFSEMKIRMH